MVKKLLLIFTVLPLIELCLLAVLDHYTNLFVTLGFIVGTGILGAYLANRQGLSAYRRIQDDLAHGRLPTDSLIDGGLILLAGVLLITPGVLSDLVGILLMIPITRAFFRRQAVAWFKRKFRLQTVVQTMSASSMGRGDVVDSYASQPVPETKSLP